VDTELVRVQSGFCTTSCGPDDAYRVRMYETTYSISRFSNINQATVVFLQNTRNASTSGRVFFWSQTGSLITSTSFTLSARQTLNLNLTTISALANMAGSITVTNTAPYGTIAGKAVALDYVNGFAFDTPMLPRRR
jgi:hypothetical protein